MLYCTTNNDSVTFDSRCPLVQNYTDSGEIFVPVQLPEFTSKEILALQEKSFGQNIADILNLFFDTELTGWDIDFCIGRSTARTAQINNKLFSIELWHNPADSFSYLEHRLYKAVSKVAENAQPTEWFRICIRIATLFASLGELFHRYSPASNVTVDLSLPGNDLAMPLAAIYSRQMGLPIGALIITTEENKSLWNLVHHGSIYLSQRSADTAVSVERLIHRTLGCADAVEFKKTYDQGKVYHIDEEILPMLNSGIFCVVTSKERTIQTINSVYKTNQYVIDPVSAMCVGGLQDYRARRGEHNPTVVFSEQSPLLHLDCIQSATGLTMRALNERFNKL